MKIAIQTGSGFAKYWIDYCQKNQIDYKVVDCYQNDIITQMEDCDVLMWHYHHAKAKDVLFAKELLYSVEAAGKKVFPDFHTSWHFDDKVAQKYLLEAINAPLVPSYVFYSQKEALQWAAQTSFPKVFKLRGGAGSSNVILAKTHREGEKLIKKAFGKGFPQYRAIDNLKERYHKYKLGKASLWDVTKGFLRIFHTTDFAKVIGNEKGYAYFQEFIPNNSSDTRVIVINNKAFAIKRMTRENDFRASGSGIIKYAKEELDERCVSISFDIAQKLKSQSIALDFVFDTNNNPLIVEISYGFNKEGYDPCTGYWDQNLTWHTEPIDPCGWMIEGIISSYHP